MAVWSEGGPPGPMFTSVWSRRGFGGQESSGFDSSLVSAFLSRGHPEPPCLDQEEFAERATRALHPGRQRVSPFPPSPEEGGRREGDLGPWPCIQPPSRCPRYRPLTL